MLRPMAEFRGPAVFYPTLRYVWFPGDLCYLALRCARVFHEPTLVAISWQFLQHRR